MKIICCTHSATRTVVEQATNTGIMFKLIKNNVRITEAPQPCENYILNSTLERELNYLQLSSSVTGSYGQILNLLSHHKQKAVLATVLKLTNATGKACC